MIDHLLWAVPDLVSGCQELAERCGTLAAPGGSHPGVGTHNALLTLGDERYLEIIARDLEQSSFSGLGRHVAGVETPGLLTWCARSHDLEATAAAARRAGLVADDLVAMSRRRPDGSELSWRLLFIDESEPETREPFGLLLPFFIEWGGATVHPSRDAPGDLRLRRFTLAHPRAADLRRILLELDFTEAEIDVIEEPRPALRALLDSPLGIVELAGPPLTRRS